MSSELRRRKNAEGEEEGKDTAAATSAAGDAARSERKTPPSNGRAVVVGGGPAGALAAKVLSDRNYTVALFESYPHPSGSKEKNMAYTIAVGPRGLRALKRAGVDPLLDLDGGVEVKTLARHTATKARVTKTEEGRVVYRRQKLASSLLDVAEKSGAEIKCGCKLIDVDFENRKATFKEGDNKDVAVEYDLLVAADGVKSTVRSLLAHNSGGAAADFGVTRIEADDMEYQAATLPPWKSLLSSVSSSGLDDCPTETVHSWADPSSNTNSLAFPLSEGGTLVVVIAPGGRLGELKTSPGEYAPALRALYPDWTPEARDNLAHQLEAEDNVPAPGGTCVWTSHLGHSPTGVVFVGDSGHGMWPSLGQGAIAALESASVLADAVDAVCGTGRTVPSAGAGVRGMDVSKASPRDRANTIAEEYQGLRHDDALAAVDLTFGGIGGRRVRGSQNMNVMFKLRVALMVVLHKISLGLVPKPAVFRVMGGDDVPFSTLKWQAQVEGMALWGILVGLLGILAARSV